MADLKDSGFRANFESGAVRDCAEGKGRCDLMPLATIGSGFWKDYFLEEVGHYVYNGNVTHLHNAFQFFIKLKYEGDAYTALLDVAKQFEDGARKYSQRNWEKGISLHCYVDSAVRHYLKWWRKDDDEPHERGVMWNLICAAWTQENHPNLCDLPFAENAGGA